MPTIYVPYQINVVNNLPGFLFTPAPVMAGGGIIHVNLVNDSGSAWAIVSMGHVLAPGNNNIWNIEVGYSPVFAITTDATENYSEVEGWVENIWEAQYSFTTPPNTYPLNFWLGLKNDTTSEVETGDFGTVLIFAQDNYGLDAP